MQLDDAPEVPVYEEPQVQQPEPESAPQLVAADAVPEVAVPQDMEMPVDETIPMEQEVKPQEVEPLLPVVPDYVTPAVIEEEERKKKKVRHVIDMDFAKIV